MAIDPERCIYIQAEEMEERIAELEKKLSDAEHRLETRIEIGWYFFHSEYPEDGLVGPYEDRDAAEREARKLYDEIGDIPLTFEEEFSFRHFDDVTSLDATIREQAAEIERLRSEISGKGALRVELLSEMEAEIARLRDFAETVCRAMWDYAEVDGATIQEAGERCGVLVGIEGDEDFKAEWGDDATMYVFAWSELARGGEG